MLLPVLAAFGLMMLQNQAPAVPAIVNDPDYPLRVQLAQTGTASRAVRGFTGYGHGNVLGPPAEGFDYSEDCNQRFAPRPEGDQYFHARWKKQDLKLEILIQEYGSSRIVSCELKVVMRQEAYELNPVRPLATAQPKLAVAVAEPDANFPLRVQLWVTRSGYGSTGSHAEGYGNVIGPPAQGLNFANECPVRLPMGHINSEIYQARWVEQGLRLEILLKELGTTQESVCGMDVGMKAEPYPATGVRPRAIPPVRSPQAPTSNVELPPP